MDRRPDIERVDDLVDLICGSLAIDDVVDADTPLISSGIVDSFDVVVLLTVFETRFGISVDPGAIDVEEFDTPRQMMKKLIEAE